MGRIPLRWWIVLLVTLGTLLNYLSRSTLGVAIPAVMASLHFTEREYGLIAGVFQIGIMMQPIAGYLLDLIGLRIGLALFAAAWAVITMAHGLAGSWQGLAAMRGLLGFAEGTAQPGGMKVVATWFPARERGLAGGVFNIGASFGALLAPPLVAGAILYWNWRAAFVIAGGLALVWAALWFCLYRSPEAHSGLSEAERADIEAGREPHLDADDAPPSILRLLGQRNFWGIALPRMLADPTWGTLTIWMPLYLTTVRHFDLAAIALFVWMPFVAADLGCLFGPALALALQKRGVSLINARRWAFTTGALLMVGIAFVGVVETPYAAIALLALGGFAHQTLSVTVITMAADLFPRREVATVAGMAGLFGNLGVLVFSLAIGGLVASVGYNPFFVTLALLDLIGAALLWALVRAPEGRST